MSAPKLGGEIFAPLKSYPKTRRVLIAYSGGLDSRVLLHLAAANRNVIGGALEAVHIDHGLQASSDAWARKCVQVCQAENIKCHVLKAELQPQSGQSVEALARDKRYELFASVMHEHDLLLLAQHADDQAETVLLQLLRGAGPEGLSAMPYSRNFSNGYLIRPLLQFPRDALAVYANSHQLTWIEDPSNAADRFDRNYLRQQIFPSIEKRFPGYRKTFARSASHCAELVAEAAESTEANHRRCLQPGTDILQLSTLATLSQRSQKQVLRSWVKSLGFKVPQAQQLSCMIEVFAGESPAPLAAVNTASYQVRRYQDGLYLLKECAEISTFHYQWQDLDSPLSIKELDITLTRQSLLEAGVKLGSTQALQVRSRQRSEKLRPSANQVRRSIKNLFQEHAIPPWERGKYPFIYQNDRLIAVLGLAVDPEFQSTDNNTSSPQIETDTADS